MTSTAPRSQHEKEFNPHNDKQNVRKPVNDSKTVRFGVEEDEVIGTTVGAERMPAGGN